MKRVLLVEYDDKTEKSSNEILQNGSFQIAVLADITNEYAKYYEKPADTETEGSEIVIGDKEIVIRPVTRQVFVRGEKKSFPYIEFDMLYYFATHPDTAIHMRELYCNVWGKMDFNESDDKKIKSTIRVHVNKLRSKIEEKGSKSQYIKTVQKVGYCFNTKK